MKKTVFSAAKAALFAIALVASVANISPARAAGTGSVSGTAKVSVDGAAAVPLNSVKVELADSAYVSYGSGNKVETTSAPDGTYSFANVADGTYYVFVGDLRNPIASTAGPLTVDNSGVWFANLDYLTQASQISSGFYAMVTVSGANAVTASDITVPGYSSVGTIVGSVLDDNGQPLSASSTNMGFGTSTDTSNVKEGVYVLDSNGNPIWHQYADLTGNISFTMPTDNYALSYGYPDSFGVTGDFVLEDGTQNVDPPTTFALAKNANSSGHNFVIHTFDLSKIVSPSAKIVGQVKSGTELKVSGISAPAGATVIISWLCDNAGNYNPYGEGPVLTMSFGYVQACSSGKVRADIEISQAGFITATKSLSATLKVVSTAKNKFAASSAKLIKNFPSISGLTNVGSVLHGNSASFRLAKVTKTSSTWFRCPTPTAAQNAKLVGCEIVKGSNANRTYKVTKYDVGSYLVYRVQVLKYSDSKIHGTIAPADSSPLVVSGY